jgi:hypothetical protein
MDKHKKEGRLEAKQIDHRIVCAWGKQRKVTRRKGETKRHLKAQTEELPSYLNPIT